MNALILVTALMITHPVYKIADGDKLHATFFDQQKSNCVVYLHGGALLFGERPKKVIPFIKSALSNGYNVIAPDYRLSPLYGIDDILSDVEAVILWAKGRCKTVITAGFSAGGYLALLSAYSFRIKPDGIVSIAGYGDIEWYDRKPDFDIPERNFKAALYNSLRHKNWTKVLIGDKPKKPYQPYKNVSKIWPPTVIMHGDKDKLVPVSEAALMYNSLKPISECAYIKMVGWKHGYGLPENVLAEYYKQAFKAFKK